MSIQNAAGDAGTSAELIVRVRPAAAGDDEQPLSDCSFKKGDDLEVGRYTTNISYVAQNMFHASVSSTASKSSTKYEKTNSLNLIDFKMT